MTESPVLFEMRGKVAWLTLNSPAKRNAMSPAMNAMMHVMLDRVETDAQCRAVVLRGAGGHFSAGMDMQTFLLEPASRGPLAERQVRQEANGWWRRLRWLGQPTIAMVEGACIGGAFAPLFACDIAIASHDARFALPEIDLGILSVANITKIVGELMGPRKGAYYLMSGQPFAGTLAENFGLVTEAVAPDALEDRVTQVAAMLAAKDPLAMQATKEALKHVLELSFAEAEDYVDQRQIALNGLQGTTQAARAAVYLAARAKGRVAQ